MKIRLALLSCLLAMAAWAADATGKWTAEFAGRNGDTRTITFDLKADGATLTGTVSSAMGSSEIKDGKVDGDTITFTLVRQFNGNEIKTDYTGKVSADQIQFQIAREGGQGHTREMTAKRAAN